MSQQQPQRPQAEQQEPVKYGDVFPVSGDLASKPIKPQDASLMQSAENLVIGRTPKGGVAATMQSAAATNERTGHVGHDDVTDITKDRGVTVTETDLPGRSIITEAVGDEVVGQYTLPGAPMTTAAGGTGDGPHPITIGEALEATAMVSGDKPVDQSDAAAIQAAEVRATGLNVNIPGGVGAEAQSAANVNERAIRDEDKVTLGEVLTDATAKLVRDKPATRRDAERVVGAELRNNSNVSTHPGGVAAAVTEAARLNQNI
ncbi:PREDICTED: late embryogenesis abundant protein D-34-like [Nelumbo nucifera]|uniref:Late embryogenesis abundant protein D-34-like n=2 Tax=Nelumbo nucifera TaxID=4432 RepID=A0A1U8BK19_NELNU|nr:PREDICTED: late embryogenesis abundant protein D-34-like [Nelumbo nucifera]DAD33691.1 TPA_asm: hypothetical protein HUJ06_012542 [Nelumbo nucifera]